MQKSGALPSLPSHKEVQRGGGAFYINSIPVQFYGLSRST